MNPIYNKVLAHFQQAYKEVSAALTGIQVEQNHYLASITGCLDPMSSSSQFLCLSPYFCLSCLFVSNQQQLCPNQFQLVVVISVETRHQSRSGQIMRISRLDHFEDLLSPRPTSGLKSVIGSRSCSTPCLQYEGLKCFSNASSLTPHKGLLLPHGPNDTYTCRGKHAQ